MAKSVAFTHTFPQSVSQDQQNLAIYFGQLLVHIASEAGRHIGALDAQNAGKFALKLEERFLSDNPKPHAFYRASVGSTIERWVYQKLQEMFLSDVVRVAGTGATAGVFTAKLATNSDVIDILFAIEYTQAHAPYLPSVFKRSRPDIRLSLAGTDKKYYEALYDLTSFGGIGHILKKGDNWINKHSVAHVAEIVWANEDILQTA